MNKEEYKEALTKVIKDIEENIDNIIDYGYSDAMRDIKINLRIRPGGIFAWDCDYYCETGYSENILAYKDKGERK